MSLAYAGVFEGIGGFGLAFDRAGMTCTSQVEISKHRRKILARYWPDTPRGENIYDVNGRDLGRPDLLCGGFPCKDTSIAAPHRTGLAGTSGGLYWQFRRLLDEHLRLVDDTRPRWVVIENPPGLLASNGGRDMSAVVHGLEELGYGWAYRVVDGRHLGSAQRRPRVLVLGHRGGDPRPAWSVLADPEGGGVGAGESDPRQGRKPGRPALGAVVDEHDGTLIFRKSRRPRSTTDYATWVADTGFNTLTGFDGGWGARQTHIVVQHGRPRVLTLTEWERLCGFPDGWTAGIPDSERFAALGDCMHVGTADWLAHRLIAVDAAVPMIGATA